MVPIISAFFRFFRKVLQLWANAKEANPSCPFVQFFVEEADADRMTLHVEASKMEAFILYVRKTLCILYTINKPTFVGI